MSPLEHAILQRQVDELLRKWFIRESMSPCAIPTLLVPKMDESWCMCVDSKRMNQITMKYGFPIPIFRDLLYQLDVTRIFLKIDLHMRYH